MLSSAGASSSTSRAIRSAVRSSSGGVVAPSPSPSSSSPPVTASTISSPYITPAATAAAAAAAPITAAVATLPLSLSALEGGGGGGVIPPFCVGPSLAGNSDMVVSLVSVVEAVAPSRSGTGASGTAAAGCVDGAPSTPALLMCAAPATMTCLTSASMRSGRPVPAATISATSGMRELPPTSTMPARSPNVSPALATTRSRVCRVPAMRGRSATSNSSRVMRTWVLMPGAMTLMVASPSTDSCSFAAVHSTRSASTARRTSGSLRSSAARDPSRVPATWLNTTWSMSIPPSRSNPCGVPSCTGPSAVSRTTTASNVPPPKS